MKPYVVVRLVCIGLSIIIFWVLYIVLIENEGLIEIRMYQKTRKAPNDAIQTNIFRLDNSGSKPINFIFDPAGAAPSALQIALQRQGNNRFDNSSPGHRLPDGRYEFPIQLGTEAKPLGNEEFRYHVLDSQNNIIDYGSIVVTVHCFEKAVSTNWTLVLAVIASILQCVAFFWKPPWEQRDTPPN